MATMWRRRPRYAPRHVVGAPPYNPTHAAGLPRRHTTPNRAPWTAALPVYREVR